MIDHRAKHEAPTRRAQAVGRDGCACEACATEARTRHVLSVELVEVPLSVALPCRAVATLTTGALACRALLVTLVWATV